MRCEASLKLVLRAGLASVDLFLYQSSCDGPCEEYHRHMGSSSWSLEKGDLASKRFFLLSERVDNIREQHTDAKIVFGPRVINTNER